jgi:hypothetical protein
MSTGLREQARILLIDHRRSLIQHLPATRGSVLARMFKPARKQLDEAPAGQATPREKFKEQYEHAIEAIRIPQIQQIEETIKIAFPNSGR